MLRMVFQRVFYLLSTGDDFLPVIPTRRLKNRWSGCRTQVRCTLKYQPKNLEQLSRGLGLKTRGPNIQRFVTENLVCIRSKDYRGIASGGTPNRNSYVDGLLFQFSVVKRVFWGEFLKNMNYIDVLQKFHKNITRKFINSESFLYPHYYNSYLCDRLVRVSFDTIEELKYEWSECFQSIVLKDAHASPLQTQFYVTWAEKLDFLPYCTDESELFWHWLYTFF